MFPELVSGRDDGYEPGAWILESGSTQRGDASCNLSDRILRVPLGGDPRSRVVRAHELTHVRVSPHVRDDAVWCAGTDPRAIECAEELRVNALVARLGFDVSLLHDGSEKHGARYLAEAGEWSEAVCFFMAVLGTGAERDYLTGIRQGAPTWMPGLRALRKRALTLLDSFDTERLGATACDEAGIGRGFAHFTLVLARILTQSMAARPPLGPEDLRRFKRSLEPGGRRPATGRFAALSFDQTVTMTTRPRATGVRRPRPSSSGTVMRYPSRLLNDELRRAFCRMRSVHGGVVVVDQSGSMDLSQEELELLVRRAPDAVVVGYSHRPGSTGTTPNAWLLADRGAVADHSRTGNVGNGVDGPVLEWALSRRRAREPVVWVTDGQVTDSHDHPDEQLTDHCARLVRRHGIIMVADFSEARRALARHTPTQASRFSEFGRVGRRIVELRAT